MQERRPDVPYPSTACLSDTFDVAGKLRHLDTVPTKQLVGLSKTQYCAILR